MLRCLASAVRSAFAVHPDGATPVAEGVAADLAATARRRARGLAWAGLLVNLPLFYVDDWINATDGTLADPLDRPYAIGLFVWRVAAVASLGGFLAWERRQPRAPQRDARLAGGLGVWFALLGGWFGAFFAQNEPSYALYGLTLLLVAVLVHAPVAWQAWGYVAACGVALAGALAIGAPPVLVAEWTSLFALATVLALFVDRALYRQSYRTAEATRLVGRANADLEAALAELRETQARLVETERQTERLRISRDLHDSVGAQLSSLLAGIELARLEGAASLGDVEADAREAMRQLRETVWALSAAPVSAGGLADRLRHFGTTQARHHETEIVVEAGAGAAEALTAPQALHLYRIGQEAVQNALKHSRARRVRVGVAAERGRLSLTVADDGTFRDPPPGTGDGAPSGFGMQTMRERAEALGGTLCVETDGGTTVRADVPLRTPQA